MRQATEAENRMIREKRFQYAADPHAKFVAPDEEEAVPYLDFSAIQNALMHLEAAVERFSDAIEGKAKADDLRQVNSLLYRCERNLLTTEGLPRRPWYRHTIYAPGYYTGYGVKTLPGIREAIEQRDWKEAREQIDIVARAIEAYTGSIDEAAGLAREAGNR